MDYMINWNLASIFPSLPVGTSWLIFPTSRLQAGIISLPQGYVLTLSPELHVTPGIDPNTNHGDLLIGFIVIIILKQSPCTFTYIFVSEIPDQPRETPGRITVPCIRPRLCVDRSISPQVICSWCKLYGLAYILVIGFFTYFLLRVKRVRLWRG